MKNRNLLEIVEKLVGHIDFKGEVNYDQESLENFEELDDMLYEIILKICKLCKQSREHKETSIHELYKSYLFSLMSIYDEIDMCLYHGKGKQQ